MEKEKLLETIIWAKKETKSKIEEVPGISRIKERNIRKTIRQIARPAKQIGRT